MYNILTLNCFEHQHVVHKHNKCILRSVYLEVNASFSPLEFQNGVDLFMNLWFAMIRNNSNLWMDRRAKI